MAQEWYYKTGNEEKGPISSKELKQLADSGQLSPTDLIRTNEKPDWKPASKVKGLFPEQTETSSAMETQPPSFESSIIVPPVAVPVPPPVFESSSENPPVFSEPAPPVFGEPAPPIFSDSPPTFSTTNVPPSITPAPTVLEPPTMNQSPSMEEPKKGFLGGMLSSVKNAAATAQKKIELENINRRLIPQIYHQIGDAAMKQNIGKSEFSVLYSEIEQIQLRIQSRPPLLIGENETLQAKTLRIAEEAKNKALNQKDEFLIGQKITELGKQLSGRRDLDRSNFLGEYFAKLDSSLETLHQTQTKYDSLSKQVDSKSRRNMIVIALIVGVIGVFSLMSNTGGGDKGYSGNSGDSSHSSRKPDGATRNTGKSQNTKAIRTVKQTLFKNFLTRPDVTNITTEKCLSLYFDEYITWSEMPGKFGSIIVAVDGKCKRYDVEERIVFAVVRDNVIAEGSYTKTEHGVFPVSIPIENILLTIYAQVEVRHFRDR